MNVIITDALLEDLKHLRITTLSGSVYDIEKKGRGEGEHIVFKNGKLIEDMGCYAVHPAYIASNGKPYHIPKSERLGFCCTYPDMREHVIVSSPIVKFEMLECYDSAPFTIEADED